jgi:hypothetical protein
MSFKLECIDEIDFIFKKNLEYESGDQVGSLDEKAKVKNIMHVYLQMARSLTNNEVEWGGPHELQHLLQGQSSRLHKHGVKPFRTPHLLYRQTD